MTFRELLPRTRVVLAPMAGGPSTTELILAATRAGALGFVAGGNRTASALAEQIEQVRAAAPVFGVNLFVPAGLQPGSMPDDPELLEAYLGRLQPIADGLGAIVGEPEAHDDDWAAKTQLLLEHPVPVVSFTFGCPPTALVEGLHAVGSQIVVGVSTLDEARRAAAAGADALVVQSGQAGGHSTSWHPAELDPSTTTPALVSAIVSGLGAAVARPVVIAAGGIANRETADAAIAAGADAVQLGTAFLLADEAGTRAPHRRALLDPASSETVMTRSFTGRPARVLVNAFTRVLDADAPLAYPQVQSATADIRRVSAEADRADHLNCYAGTRFRDAEPGTAAEIVARATPSIAR